MQLNIRICISLFLCTIIIIVLGCENHLSDSENKQEALNGYEVVEDDKNDAISDSLIENRLRAILKAEMQKKGDKSNMIQLPDDLLDKFDWKVVDNRKLVDESKNEGLTFSMQSSASEAIATVDAINTPTCLSTTMVQFNYRDRYSHVEIDCNVNIDQMITQLRNGINNDSDAHMTAEISIINATITFKEKTPSSFANGEDVDIAILGSDWQNGQPFDVMNTSMASGSDGTSGDHPPNDYDDRYDDPPDSDGDGESDPIGPQIFLQWGSNINCTDNSSYVDMLSYTAASESLQHIQVASISWNELSPIAVDWSYDQNSNFVVSGVSVTKNPFDPSEYWEQVGYHWWGDVDLAGTYGSHSFDWTNC